MTQLTSNTPDIITKQRIQSGLRMLILENHFGRASPVVESMMYAMCDKILPGYNGGYFEYYELNNGGFFWELNHSESNIQVQVPFGNHFDNVMSSEAAGIVISLFTLSLMIEKAQKNASLQTVFSDHYRKLIDYADQHGESALIFAAID